MPHAWASGRRRAPVSALAALVACFAPFLFTLEPPPAFSQDLGNPKYQFQRRSGPDRQEGIKALEVSGARLDLISVLLDVQGATAGTPGDTYRIGFFLAEAEGGVRITVRDYDRFRTEKYHYLMIPSRTTFDQGFQVFGWNSSLARELGIGLDGLGALAKLGGHGYNVVAPVLLQETPFAARIRVRGVRFVFVPNETMTVEYLVCPEGNRSQVLLSSAGENWPKDQRSAVSWPGRDPKGQPVGEGHYVLALTARVKTIQGVVDRIPLDFTFYYKPEIVAGP